MIWNPISRVEHKDSCDYDGEETISNGATAIPGRICPEVPAAKELIMVLKFPWIATETRPNRGAAPRSLRIGPMMRYYLRN